MKWSRMPTDKDLKETDVSGTCRDIRTTKIRRTHPRLDRTGEETEELTPRFPERFGHLQHQFKRRRPAQRAMRGYPWVLKQDDWKEGEKPQVQKGTV